MGYPWDIPVETFVFGISVCFEESVAYSDWAAAVADVSI